MVVYCQQRVVGQYGVVIGGALCTVWALKTVVQGSCIKKEVVIIW